MRPSLMSMSLFGCAYQVYVQCRAFHAPHRLLVVGVPRHAAVATTPAIESLCRRPPPQTHRMGRCVQMYEGFYENYFDLLLVSNFKADYVANLFINLACAVHCSSVAAQSILDFSNFTVIVSPSDLGSVQLRRKGTLSVCCC